MDVGNAYQVLVFGLFDVHSLLALLALGVVLGLVFNRRLVLSLAEVLDAVGDRNGARSANDKINVAVVAGPGFSDDIASGYVGVEGEDEDDD